MHSRDLSKLQPVERMAGEDGEETTLLKELASEARRYIMSFKWCHGITKEYFGFGVGGVMGLFLFNINADVGIDEWLWVVVGDLPSCYFVTDDVCTISEALSVYCDLMGA